MVGSPDFLNKLYREMCKEFGQITRDRLPFAHCGCMYSKTAAGLKIDQTNFAARLQQAPDPGGADDRKLKPEELTQ